jgi:hypothetical protein
MALGMKQANRIVVGLFPNRADAYRAIEELRESGFSPVEIGAAFRSGNKENWFRQKSTAEETENLNRRRQEGYSGSDVTGIGVGTAGAASGTNAVTPAGLSTGAGTAKTAPGRPGPIPGATIPHRRTVTDPTASMGAVDEGLEYATGMEIDVSVPDDVSSSRKGEERKAWWQEVKNFFAPDEERARKKQRISKDAVNYGTGSGHLPLQTSVPSWQEYTYNYNEADFGSLLMELGLESQSARYFAHTLPPGGAVVTVHTASRANEAELILEGNQGRVRIESCAMEEVDLGEQYSDDVMVVFGEVRRAYWQRDSQNAVRAEDLEGFPGRIRHLRKSA